MFVRTGEVRPYLILAAGLAGACLALVFYFQAERADAVDRSSEALQPIDASPQPGSLGRGPLAIANPPSQFHRALHDGQNLREALGVADTDQYAKSLVPLAAVACAADHDPFDSTKPSLEDPNRVWAVEKLLQLCEGFDPTDYQLQAPRRDLVGRLRQFGPEVAAREAFEAIETESNYFELYEAGQVLLETGQMPQSALDGQAAAFGHTELVKAWANATTLVLCDEAGGCGPDSLPVAGFCANLGCRPQSDMRSAFQQRLPSGEYAAMRQFYVWMGGRRSR